MYTMYPVNPALSLSDPGCPLLNYDAGVMMRLDSKEQIWDDEYNLQAEVLLSQWKGQSPRGH